MSNSQTQGLPDGAKLERTESYQWPSGHIGHISPSQQQALDTFKTLCEQKGYYVPANDDRDISATHDDETLLRYLRARKFIPPEAFTQFKETEDWRKENELDRLYETIDINEYEQTRRLYPQWTGRRDKRGIPFYVFEVNQIDSKAIAAQDAGSGKKDKAGDVATTAKVPRRMLRLFALYENLCRFVLPLCSAIPDRQHLETPISQSSNLVDISKVGFTKFWNLRYHMSDASKLATAHYPETLDRIFVVGAPSFFPTVWSWAQKWFDPITVSKIFILSEKDMAPTLAKYIDMDNVPKKYGGNLDWKFGDMPSLDSTIVETLRWTERVEGPGHRTFPVGPIRWHYDNDGDLMATAIGTENGVPRTKKLAALRPEAGVARLALSPGKTDGKVANLSSLSGAAAVETSVAAAQVPATTTATADPETSVGKSSSAAVQETSRAGTYTVPYHDPTNAVASPPVDTRQGTSTTRLEQQKDTHADGTLAHGSPETRIDGQGERSFVMEPATVGQAPKEHPVPDAAEQIPSPTLIEQAQEVAGQAYAAGATVLGAVGLGSRGKEQEGVVKEKKTDPEIDGMEGAKVEEYLRLKTMSQPPA